MASAHETAVENLKRALLDAVDALKWIEQFSPALIGEKMPSGLYQDMRRAMYMAETLR